MARLNSASAPSKSPASNSLVPRLRWSIAARRLTCAQRTTTFSRKQKSRSGKEERRMGLSDQGSILKDCRPPKTIHEDIRNETGLVRAVWCDFVDRSPPSGTHGRTKLIIHHSFDHV